MMDEIAEEIKRRNLGIEVIEEEKIGCLLWMDDVVLMAETVEELQKIMDITSDIANRYRIVFGKEKSKIMVTGRGKKEDIFKLGDMTLEHCNSYTY
jgi:GT2 family glycosyltransferase